MIVDAGLSFPRDEHLGVDLVLPDFETLEDRRDKIRAVVLTHGHEDHVGALPYFLREIGSPEVWATKLTLGLVKSKLDEHGLGALDRADRGRPRGRPGPDRPVRGAVRAHGALDSRRGRGRARHARRPDPLHRGLQDRPHARGRLPHRRRPARGARQRGRRPHARRLDERRAARRHLVRAHRGGGVPHDHPAARRPGADRVVRVEHPPRAAGDRRRARDRPAGRARRALPAQEREHRAQPRLPGRPGGDPGQARRPRRAARPSTR